MYMNEVPNFPYLFMKTYPSTFQFSSSPTLKAFLHFRRRICFFGFFFWVKWAYINSSSLRHSGTSKLNLLRTEELMVLCHQDGIFFFLNWLKLHIRTKLDLLEKYVVSFSYPEQCIIITSLLFCKENCSHVWRLESLERHVQLGSHEGFVQTHTCA